MGHVLTSSSGVRRELQDSGSQQLILRRGVKSISFLLFLIFFISLYLLPEQASAGGYRTAKYADWVNSVDVKGKQAVVKRKNDKVFFKLTLTVASNSNILLLDFGMNATGAITRGVAKTETLATFNGKKLKDTLTTVVADEIIQIDGIGYMGKKMKLKYQWGKAKPVTLKLDTDYMDNHVGLPMPTLHNVGEELFPKGFGQTAPTYFANGLIVGVPQGTKGANSVIHKNYMDVLKSLSKKVKSGILTHTNGPRCLDSLGKKLFDKQQKSLPPDKFNNKLFAEALTLKLNIAASATEKFPIGFGEQEYSNTGSVFHHKLVSEISAYADTIISCITPTTIGAVTLSELYDLLVFINSSYAPTPYTVDTISFASKTKLTALLASSEAVMLQPSGTAPKVFNGDEQFDNQPKEFALQQNYPNPFNPATKLSFVIGHSSLVSLKVFNLLGQEISTLIDREQYESGEYDVSFDASSLTSGIYFYKITAESVDENGAARIFSDMKRMTLIK
ncbi:MAG: T9SS type A sorting domain-containing protein [Bacteroidetes bacterium]|nr:MAG: T9SS type A sorting domain-containing protein [Bacteroidota bacterium]